MAYLIYPRNLPDFDSKSSAITLSTTEVTDENIEDRNYYKTFRNRKFTKTHSDGWTITAEIHCDYYSWINEFEATHPIYGFVKGDFEVLIEASSREAFEHFYKNHQPNFWDYYDI